MSTVERMFIVTGLSEPVRVTGIQHALELRNQNKVSDPVFYTLSAMFGCLDISFVDIITPRLVMETLVAFEDKTKPDINCFYVVPDKSVRGTEQNVLLENLEPILSKNNIVSSYFVVTA